MAEITYSRIQMRRRTSAEWTALNEILKEGEIGVVIGTHPIKFKIGDGITPWNDLPFAQGEIPQGQYAGKATPVMNPGPQTTPVYFTANQAGTYTYFGGVVLPANSQGYINWNGTSYSIDYFTMVLDGYLNESSNIYKYKDRETQPIIAVGGNVIKTSTTVVITGSVGFYHGDGKYALVAPGTYTLTNVQSLVVSNVNKSLTYDGGVGNQPVLTPTVKLYNVSNEYDFPVAWRDASGNIVTIWDTIGIPDMRVVNRDLQATSFGGGITKTSTSTNSTLVISGSMGFLMGVGQYAIVASGTYVMTNVQCLVVTNVNKKLRYDGSVGNQPILIPTVKIYTTVTESDVIIAWRDGDQNLQTKWDLIGAPDFHYIRRDLQPSVFSGGNVSKSGFSYTFKSCGFLMGNKQYVSIADGTYSMNNIIECLVVSNINKNLRYDGTAGNQPKVVPTVKTYVNLTETDVVIAWRVNSVDTWSIFDNIIRSVRITTPQIDKASFMSFLIKVFLMGNLRILFLGNSIWMSSNWWANGIFPFFLASSGAPYSTKIGLDAEQPFHFTDRITSRKLYDLLMRYSVNIPVYRRFDFGSTFDYDSGSPTFGQDKTPGSKFFIETGTFKTFVGSLGNGIDTAKYGTYGATAQVPMTLSDALEPFTGSIWYNSQSQEGFTRLSYAASAGVQFTIPVGYSKFRIKLRNNIDGDTITTTLTNCTGVSSINLAYGVVTHTNNSYFIDVEFTVTNTSNPATVVLTKSSNTSKNIAYWGACYFNEPCTIVNNYAYGGQTTEKNFHALPDLLAAEPYDLIVWEVQLLNDRLSTTFENSKTYIQNYVAKLLLENKPILAVIPQRGSFEGDIATDKMWGMAKSILMTNNIPFLDLGVIESTVIRQLGRGSGLNYLYDTFGGVHPVGKGIDALSIMFEGLINN